MRSALRQNLPAPAGTLFALVLVDFVLGHCAFGTILDAPPPTSFTAFLALSVVNFTSVKRADVYLTGLLNTFVQ